MAPIQGVLMNQAFPNNSASGADMSNQSGDEQATGLGLSWPMDARIGHRFLDHPRGLRMHWLEAGNPKHPAVLMLHGFPELAFSWRKLLPLIALQGFYAIAPDLRGYGATTGWDSRYDGPWQKASMMQLVADVVGFLQGIGVREVHSLIGHDFGSPLAGWCSLMRPDLFQRLVLMSAPFSSPATMQPVDPHRADHVDAAFAQLNPARKHYQIYYTTEHANRDMLQCPEGLKAFLRAYYHVKSADWAANQPHPLGDRSASTMAVMPTYYIMRADENMAQTVLSHHPSQDQVLGCKWLPDDELAVYVDAYKRTGFQGGLNWYRCAWDPSVQFAQQAYAGAKLRLPTLFLAGEADWGMYQWPGDLEAMQAACLHFEGAYRIPAAGHWLQQEQPLAVMDYLERFWQRS